MLMIRDDCPISLPVIRFEETSLSKGQGFYSKIVGQPLFPFLQYDKPGPIGEPDRKPPKSTVYWLCFAQKTTSHPLVYQIVAAYLSA
jgi:hypothetical protein